MPQKPVIDGFITSKYGLRMLAGKEEFHPGLDISSKSAKPEIIVAYKGIVMAHGFSQTFGNRVWLKLSNNLFNVYAHLDEINPKITTGEKIPEGFLIGIMGNTGHSFGKHLHFELRTTMDLTGKSINPQEIYRLYCNEVR
jgi:murein DD-endopeptidase MepM/ murein hydrolase activator NlpD